MSYVVLDLEWNQAMSAKSSVFNKLPIHLCGEIIQIGAVKLDKDMRPHEEYKADIKPVYFRRMHYKVKKLTGFDKERLNLGRSFLEVFDEFRAWCGEDVVFLTWGYDDRRVMEQNIIIHDLDWEWIDRWVNLQLIYNVQTGGDKNQKALSAAMEHFDIEQTRSAHDALGDAYNTALVCSHLDLEAGLAQYEEAAALLATRLPAEKHTDGERDILEHRAFQGFAERSAVFEDEQIAKIACPVCGAEMALTRWVNQGDRRHMSLASCEEHGKYLVRLKLRKCEDESYAANRIVYAADKEMEAFYREKANQKRRRGQRHSHRRPRGGAQPQ